MERIDTVKLNFDQEGLFVLNVCLAVVMFGVALGIKLSDFTQILKSPKPAILGIISQFVLLPALTYLLVIIAKPTPSIALGMILVAACPGGNISNFISHISGGNSALSVTLTAFATAMALFFTPFNLQVWGSFYPPTHAILREVSINPFEVFKTIVLILLIPLIAGMLMNRWKPGLSAILGKVLKPLSVTIFIILVAVAFSKNTDIFTQYIHYVILLVFLHNAIAISTGFFVGKFGGLDYRDQRTLAIETGIQNSGLGLLLIFSFFDGLGGMAIVAGWWGIWHIISGLAIASYWSIKNKRSQGINKMSLHK